MKPKAAKRPPKPRITRKFAISVDETEGICRVECRTNLVVLTRRDFGRIITEFLYQRGALPSDRPEDPREVEEV